MPAAPALVPAHARPGRQPRRVLVSALALAALVGGCSAERPELAEDESPTTSSTASSTVATEPEADEQVQAAQVTGESIEVFADATSDVPTQTIEVATAGATPGVPLVFLVKDQADDRLEVYLPGPPGGSTGWVREADVSLASVPFRIEVRLAEHRLRVYEDDEVVLDEPAGVGATDRPEPGGVYYLRELLQPPDATGPYGSYAYGLSGFTTSLSSFSDGQGFVGIHGTSDPTLVGQDSPRGSIRLSNEVIARLVDEIGLPLGTPVEVLP